jgi:hypothetical protein
VSAFYRCVLLPGHWPAEQHAFDMLVNYLHDHEHSIPVNFVLGFFVHFIVERWKGIFDNIGFVDLPAHYIATYVRGTDPHAVAQRRKLVRLV